MADEAAENDTFTSVDLLAPTRSSLGASDTESTHLTSHGDTTSLSELLDHDNSLHGYDDKHFSDIPCSVGKTGDNITSINSRTNFQDTTFIWSLTKRQSSEARCQNTVQDDVDADDALTIPDDGDICGTFDTTTLHAHEHNESSLPASPLIPQSSCPGQSPNPHPAPSSPQSPFLHNIYSSQISPCPDTLCPTEKPPFPSVPNNFNCTPAQIDHTTSHVMTSTGTLNHTYSPKFTSESVKGQGRQTAARGKDVILCPQITSSFQDFCTCSVLNPFAVSEAHVGTSREFVVISRAGTLGAEEKAMLQDIATSIDCPKARLVKILIDTIVFQHQQLNTAKESEINLTGSAHLNLSHHHSEAQEKSFVMDALVDEVDTQQTKILELEAETVKLMKQLKESESKNAQVEEYYSQFVGNFKLTTNVASELKKVNEKMESRHQENLATFEKKDVQIEDFAKRLLGMEDIVSDARKRVQILEAENAQLRVAAIQCGASASENSRPTSPIITSFVPSLSRTVQENDCVELLQRVKKLEVEIDNLRFLQQKTEGDFGKAQGAFLSVKSELDEARTKIQILHKQRDAAETKHHQLRLNVSEERKRSIALSNELSKNLVNFVSELDQKDSDIRNLRCQLDDRESAFRSLQCANQDLEDQLQACTEAALDRSRLKHMSDDPRSFSLVNTVVEGLQKELEKAQLLLEERTRDCEKVKKDLLVQNEANIALRKECSRHQAANAVRFRSETACTSRQAGDGNSLDEDRFLRRLSERIGCRVSNNRELVEQLAKRVESMMVERTELQRIGEAMRLELFEREQALHKLRSEMQAEISALKCEVSHLENLKSRAQDDLKASESRLLQVLHDGDMARRASMGDITASSIGTRGWLFAEEGDILSQRGSMFSSTACEDSVRWNDPAIEAAVQSLNALIGTKDTLAARNRELREKLQILIDGLPNKDDGRALKTVMIQSKELQDELSGVVGMQQDIIDRLSQDHRTGTQAIRYTSGDEPFSFHQRNSIQTQACNDANITVSTVSRHPLGEAMQFLKDQLTSTRALYAEKQRANVQLCGVVDELHEELHHYKSAKMGVENALLKLQETHDCFLQRLADITGGEKSIISLEDSVRTSLIDNVRTREELGRRERESKDLGRRLFALVAQKRLLTHMIGIYQSKYHLNILAVTTDERNSPKRRLRTRVLAVIAVMKLRNISRLVLSSPSSHFSFEYNVPDVDILQTDNPSIALLDATLAVAAIPRLEKAIIKKEEEISRLESSLESLSHSVAAHSECVTPSIRDLPRSSFVYEEDVINRKNDMSQRLHRIIREKEDLENRLSKEKECRLNVEAKSTKYLEKIASYKKRLGKISSNAEAKENAYKAAIRYLKNKADKAVSNDFNMYDENTIPETNASEDARTENVSEEPKSAAKSLLRATLAKAENELKGLQSGTLAHDEKRKHVKSLRRTIDRLDKSNLTNHMQSPSLTFRSTTAG